ncbi:MAG: hypothetical protein Phyf2KO_05120 [Phycisphaerales bacterium]
MRSLFAFVLLLVTAVLSGCAHQADWVRVDHPIAAPPEPVQEFRGLWVATVDNIDWPSEPGLSRVAQKAEAVRILDLAVELRLNAIVLQVRPCADALYRSPYEPWSAFLTGEQGKNPGYDPLAFWIEEAHARGLDLHAWINPFRAWHPMTPGNPAKNSIVTKRPEFLVEFGEYFWLDPGDRQASKLTLSVIEDIVRRYDIDGLHVDDYFYPYPVEGVPFNDSRSFDAYAATGGKLDKSNWRRHNIDRFVRDMYASVKRHRPEVLVGISPFGIWRPGHPEGVVGFDAYEGLAADAKRWLREGWLDYVSPQLYWKIESEGQPFKPLLDWWAGNNPAGRHVWPGIYLTRIKAEGGWAPDDITSQIELLSAHPEANGFVLFSAVGMTEDRQSINNALSMVLPDHANTPDSPWLGTNTTRSPTVRIKVGSELSRVSISGMPRDAEGWVLWTKAGEIWESLDMPATLTTASVPDYKGVDPVLCIAVQPIHAGGRRGSSVVFRRIIPAPAQPAELLKTDRGDHCRTTGRVVIVRPEHNLGSGLCQ